MEAVQSLLQLLAAFFSQRVACSGQGGEQTGVRVRVRVRPPGRPVPRPRPLLTIEVQFLQLGLVCHSLRHRQSSVSLDLTERQVQLLKQEQGVVAGRNVGQDKQAPLGSLHFPRLGPQVARRRQQKCHLPGEVPGTQHVYIRSTLVTPSILTMKKLPSRRGSVAES